MNLVATLKYRKTLRGSRSRIAGARRNGKEVCRAHFVQTVTFRRLCPRKSCLTVKVNPLSLDRGASTDPPPRGSFQEVCRAHFVQTVTFRRLCPRKSCLTVKVNPLSLDRGASTDPPPRGSFQRVRFGISITSTLPWERKWNWLSVSEIRVSPVLHVRKVV